MRFNCQYHKDGQGAEGGVSGQKREDSGSGDPCKGRTSKKRDEEFDQIKKVTRFQVGGET